MAREKLDEQVEAGVVATQEMIGKSFTISNETAYTFDVSAFTPGTLVRIKSGGPTMTVEGHRENGLVLCCWFTGDGRHLMHDEFHPASLVAITKEG